MFKNTASQKWVVFAFEDEGGTNPGEPVTGDAANITANLRLDGGAANAVDDVNPTELEDGYYIFDITAAESNGDCIVIAPVSATANVNVIGVPGVVYTTTDVSGIEAKIDTAQADLDIITDTDGVILGAAGVDLVWDEVLTAGSHNVVNSAGRRLRSIQDGGSTYGGFIWIDTVNGSAGTIAYENGTSDNPVNTIADANTLAAAVNIPRFKVAPGSTITFAATQSNQAFFGENWTLALGNQSIAGTFFMGATVSGIGTGSDYHFENCHMGAVTLANGDLDFCSLDDTFTMSATGTYRLMGCYSGVAGEAAPTIDFGAAVGATAFNCRHYSGGMTINNKDATGADTMSLEGNGQLVVAASSSGAISVRGNFKVTNTGGATITYDDNTQGIADIEVDTTSIETKVDTIDTNVDAILLDTGTDGVVVAASTQTDIADALLNRDMSAVSDTNARSPLNALRLLRNKYSVTGTTLTVTKEDDATSAWTALLTTDATADPVTGSDPT
jgi:hypothetical protein